MKSFNIEKGIKKIRKTAVYIGVLEESASYIYESGATLKEVATYMNFGTDKAPARNFVSLPFEIKRQNLKQTQKKLLKGDFDPAKTINLLGEYGRNIVLEAFESGGFGLWSQDAPATIEKKGSSQILIDTGTLMSAIGYTVVNNV